MNIKFFDIEFLFNTHRVGDIFSIIVRYTFRNPRLNSPPQNTSLKNRYCNNCRYIHVLYYITLYY